MAINPAPAISVITVVKNAERHLDRAIRSLLDQDYAALEYIVIDGGSTDGTAEILDRYGTRIACRVGEPDCGIYDAMNKGTVRATGDWVYFLGADDILLPGVLSRMAAYLEGPPAIHYGDVYMPDRHILYRGPVSPYRLMFSNICHQAIFYPRTVFSRHQFSLKYRAQADHHFNMRCLADGRYSFVHHPLLIAIYNSHEGFSGSYTDTDFRRDEATLIRTFFPYPHYLLFRLNRIVERAKESFLDLVRRKG